MDRTVGAGRPLKQEQEPAAPDIKEVAPGVLRLQLPIHFDGLGHVNTYALEDDRGVALVDPGLPGPGSWHALLARLDAAGIPLARVHTVIVTHSHPDHFGGAGRLAHSTGAEIMTHSDFRTWSDAPRQPHCDEEDDADHGDTTDDGNRDAGRPWSRKTPWGTRGPRPPRRQRLLFHAAKWRLNPWFKRPVPTRRVQDGEVVQLARREWISVHTPGHTLDHLCLYDPTERVLLSGDHVLPSITPHVPGLDAGPDPLAGFVASLDKIARVGPVDVALPAHGHPFHDLPGRVEEIKVHHDQRLERLRAASIALGPATVTELSHELFARSRWGTMAESETYAHLEHLRRSGNAERRREGDRLLYLVEPSSTTSTKRASPTN